MLAAASSAIDMGGSKASKSAIAISLDQTSSITGQNGIVLPHIYTTHDIVSGSVSVKGSLAVSFNEVHIMLEGTSFAKVTNFSPVAQSVALDARQLFLRLRMPVFQASCDNQPDSIPFHFVIPDHLLPTACTHTVASPHVNDAHLLLPPSMGDLHQTGFDDLAPDLARIRYCIRAKHLRFREADGTAAVVAECSEPIFVMPKLAEAPPMHVTDDCEYVLEVKKTLRRGMFKGKLGTITVRAAQTKAFVTSTCPSRAPSSVATVTLRFDPKFPGAQPPRLGALSAKIKAATFHAVRANEDLATRSDLQPAFDIHRACYTTSVPLSCRSVEGVQWDFHTSSPHYTRRNSGYSSCDGSTASLSSSPSSSSSAATDGWYEATILVPITLPANRRWLPTFHSCLISRVYRLQLELAVHTPGTGVPATTAQLRLPVQVASEGRPGELLRPRTLSVPAEEFQLGGSSVLTPRELAAAQAQAAAAAVQEEQEPDQAPPEYRAFTRFSISGPASVAVS